MSDPPSPGTADRRAAIRHHPNRRSTDCEVEAAEKEERWPATVWDISQSGVGLLVERPFDPGTLLEVELEGSRQHPGQVLSMRVIRVHRHEKGWLLGCALETALLPEELGRLVARNRGK